MGDGVYGLDGTSQTLAMAQDERPGDQAAVAVMFTDIVGSTESAAALGDRRWREIRNAHQVVIRHELARFSGTEIDTSGDGFFARFEAPADAVSCACAISDGVRSVGIDVRIGLHADGADRQSSELDFVFIAVANRVSSLATAGEVLLTGTMKSMLTGSTIPLTPRGRHRLRGVSGAWDIFAVDRGESERPAKAPLSPGANTGVDPRDLPRRTVLTLMFTDILDATAHASRLGQTAWRELQNAHDALITREVERSGGVIVDTAGDQVFASFERPMDALSCARAIQVGVRPLGIDLRVGLHTGEVEEMGDKVGGIAVHFGARVLALAGPGEILVTSTVKDLVEGSGLSFDQRGQHDLKGVPGARSVFALTSD